MKAALVTAAAVTAVAAVAVALAAPANRRRKLLQRNLSDLAEFGQRLLQRLRCQQVADASK